MPVDVLGAGLAGQVAALALGQAGQTVRLWGRAECAPSRAVALSAPSIRYLSSLCPAVTQLGAPIESIHVSRQGRLGRTLLQASDHRQANFGRVIANDALSDALDQCLSCERIDERVETLKPGWQVNGRASEFVVLAAAAPTLLHQAGIAYSQPQMSGQLWAAVARGCDTQTAYERFTASGPLAVLPMGQGRASVVWQVDEPVSDIRQVNAALGWRVRLQSIEHESLMPIRLHRSHQLARPGLAVVGNASQFMHPVAGQGFNLILRQIQRLIRSLGQDLAPFNRDALADQAIWFKTTQTLAQVFQPDWPLQGLALSSLEASHRLQADFVTRFMEGA